MTIVTEIDQIKHACERDNYYMRVTRLPWGTPQPWSCEIADYGPVGEVVMPARCAGTARASTEAKAIRRAWRDFIDHPNYRERGESSGTE